MGGVVYGGDYRRDLWYGKQVNVWDVFVSVCVCVCVCVINRQTYRRTDGQTDGRTPDRQINI